MRTQNATLQIDGSGRCLALGAGIAFALNAQGTAPDWVMLIPRGPRIVGNDGRVFSLKEPSDVVVAFKKTGLSLPIDINHAEFLKAPAGDESPAAGWIEELDVRDGAIWGRVVWTPSGEAALNAKSYRYISPAILSDKAGEVISLAGAGLVNRPNFNMAALNAQETQVMKDLLKKLGLAETASENDAIAAVDALTTSLNAAKSATPSLQLFVPRADYDLVSGQLAALNARVDADNKASRDKEVSLFLDGAVRGMKIAPASREQYLALCASDEGFEQVRKLVAGMPALFKEGGFDTERLRQDAQNGGGSVSLNARERELIALGGVSEADFLKAKEAREAAYRAADAA